MSQLMRETEENHNNPELCRKCFRARPNGGRTHRLNCGCLALCADCHENMGEKDTIAVLLFCPATPQCTPQVTPPGTPH